MNTQAFLKTDREVKLELNKQRNEISRNEIPRNEIQRNEIPRNEIQRNEIQRNDTPRYGTTVDLKTNKIIDQTDKHLTRDRNLKSEKLNIKKHRISRINVDSRNRNKDPKNIISRFIKINSPFLFIQGSNILEIKIPNGHDFNVDDNITITNVNPQIVTLRSNSLTLKKNSKYLYINHQQHGFYGSKNIISISGVINADPSDSFFGNIPLAIINATHNIILIESNGVIDYNNYLIDLGIYSDNDFIYTESSYEIGILTYNGIHIKYINASYPIINNIQQGYHIIIETTNTSIKIKLPETATSTNTTSIGNNDILIGFISSTINGYPDPDFYKFDLKKTYYKVKKVKLVSTEIPNTEMLIKNLPTNLKNNMLYWQIQDDGDSIYSINILSGNYDADSLKAELTDKINNVSRNFGSYLDKNLYSEKCKSVIILNPANNLFSLQITSNITLSKNITINNSKYLDPNKRINIIHPYHNLKAGDFIQISNAFNVIDSVSNGIKYYIPSNIINTTHQIESIGGINNYVIKLNKYNATIINVINDDSITDGGDAVIITFPLTIRLLFNYKDTIGNILGFKNVGDNYSITIFDKIITNKISYSDGSELNSVGLIDQNIPILNFRTYPYILMVSEIFSSNINYKDSTGVFAKLFLTGNPGSMIYDQYVQLTEILPSAVSSLNSLEFKFLTPDGIPYNFNGQDHSYTLELYEELEENFN
jgi:hypothetical protein